MIPILGQPKLIDWMVTLEVECPCGQVQILAGQPGSMRICRKCGDALAIGPVMVLNRTGQPMTVQPSEGLQVIIGHGKPEQKPSE
jgi:hypothetical protein